MLTNVMTKFGVQNSKFTYEELDHFYFTDLLSKLFYSIRGHEEVNKCEMSRSLNG